jgi:hypothetical protein
MSLITILVVMMVRMRRRRSTVMMIWNILRMLYIEDMILEFTRD